MTKMVLAIATATAALTMAGCSSSDGASSAQPVQTAPTSSTASSSSSSSAPAKKSRLARKKSAGSGFHKFKMPDETGRGLQAAQDDMQDRAHNPLYITHSKDATGQDRFQIFDRDWQVCSQNYPAGKKVHASTEITFRVVKLDESCP